MFVKPVTGPGKSVRPSVNAGLMQIRDQLREMIKLN